MLSVIPNNLILFWIFFAAMGIAPMILALVLNARDRAREKKEETK